MSKLLDGLTILDFTQFLSGPAATLRLADLGARVIKVEHFENGDLSRSIYVSHFNVASESAFFQAINRGKESLKANLKDVEDLALVKRIAAKADVVVHNFRPGVMQRLGLSFDELKQVNDKLIYAEISGYGAEGPWAEKPGQDLLLQAVSGLTSLSGSDSDGAVPMGLAIADYLAGNQLVQGILASLLGDEATLVQVSMLEAILDFQFEPLTLFYQDGELPVRGEQNSAHSLVGAPYGLYQCANGYIALAMGAVPKLGELLGCDPLLEYTDSSRWFAERDQIKKILADHLVSNTCEHWLGILEPADIWCAQVMNWQQLLAHDGFKVLDMLQEVVGSAGSYQTTRCPIRFDDQLIKNSVAAPVLGEHSDQIRSEFS
ncbi:CaiB/BaiF CoA transferase family protein [Agaribacterium haliotis]|uniref:CaiB/BaiF CoA transferase family protein n=1 Tax=Agaribacterium haliotis TaxID=2013869 RepID=UPI000BB5778B|nr:CaiB/BaiF CoA-transferase family protein [Agaribacterium haliotis]